MANVQDLMKGELDWHEKVNANFHAAQSTADSAVTAAENAANAASAAQTSADNAQQSANQKLPKPVNSPFTEGLVYQNSDGTTTIRPGGGFKYTVEVDNGADGSPDVVTYFDDCFSFNPGKGSDLGDWGTTDLVKNYFRPCVIQPNAEVPAYFLMQNNMTKKEDGSAANLTGADGDVMIQVRKLYGKFTNRGKTLRISLSNVKEDDTWLCFNNVAGEEKDFIYVGAFEAGVVSGANTVLRSISGLLPLVGVTRDTFRTYAANRGDGYYMNNPFPIFLLEIMFLMIYKTRASQEVLGKGRSKTSSAAITGLLADKPFCYGNQDGVTGMKFLGYENFYGNVWENVDGVVLVGDTVKLTRDPSKYNDTGDGYEISQVVDLSRTNGYVKEVQGTNDLGFFPKVVNDGAAEVSFWCDVTWFNPSTKRNVFFGGHYAILAGVGAFCWDLNNEFSYISSNVGSRLYRV